MRELDRVVPFTKWANTDAVNCMNCPKCLQPAGDPCRTPQGRRCLYVHWQRTKALSDTGYTANSFQVGSAELQPSFQRGPQ